MTVYGYSPSGPLTPRMRDVLRAASRGLTVSQTAAELGISESTVHAIRAALCARLGVSSVTAAIVPAIARGELT